VSDHVLLPIHGLLQWCAWLVAVDTGYALSFLMVPVKARKKSILIVESLRNDSLESHNIFGVAIGISKI